MFKLGNPGLDDPLENTRSDDPPDTERELAPSPLATERQPHLTPEVSEAGGSGQTWDTHVSHTALGKSLEPPFSSVPWGHATPTQGRERLEPLAISQLREGPGELPRAWPLENFSASGQRCPGAALGSRWGRACPCEGTWSKPRCGK